MKPLEIYKMFVIINTIVKNPVSLIIAIFKARRVPQAFPLLG